MTSSPDSANIQQAAVAAATFYTQMFSNPEVFTINIGYGELNGMQVAAGNLAESESVGSYYSYATIRSALQGDSAS